MKVQPKEPKQQQIALSKPPLSKRQTERMDLDEASRRIYN